MGDCAQRTRCELGLEARHAIRSDDRVMASAGRQLQAIAAGQVDHVTRSRKAEADRSVRRHDDLVVRVFVRAVPIAGTVRPGAGDQALGSKTGSNVHDKHGRMPGHPAG